MAESILFEQDPEGGPGVVGPNELAKEISIDLADAMALARQLPHYNDEKIICEIFRELRNMRAEWRLHGGWTKS